MNEIKNYLKNLLGKNYIYLYKNGSTAIKRAVKILNKKTVLIPDQGGWLTYLRFNHIKLKTKYGVLNLKDLENKANKNSVLLVNSLPAYIMEQPIEEIIKICKEKNCLIINDIAGSIGLKVSKFGDILVGSFRKWKPVNFNYGGFIATNLKLNLKDEIEQEKLKGLMKNLKQIPKRLKYLRSIIKKIKQDLKDFNIIHRNYDGLVVIIKYKNENEKNKIIKYCKNNILQYTECPRYIRINEKAISIEVKRK